MESHLKKLIEKAIAATVSAIEIYNKPDFRYRSETFCILAINGWELLFKAKWLSEEIHVTEQQILDGYPWEYNDLVKSCKDRYSDFKKNSTFHKIRDSICNELGGGGNR